MWWTCRPCEAHRAPPSGERRRRCAAFRNPARRRPDRSCRKDGKCGNRSASWTEMGRNTEREPVYARAAPRKSREPLSPGKSRPEKRSALAPQRRLENRGAFILSAERRCVAAACIWLLVLLRRAYALTLASVD